MKRGKGLLESLKVLLSVEDAELDETLLVLFERFWRKRQSVINASFHRTLPLGDYVVDRWRKASLLGFGRNTSIYDSAITFGDVQVGENTWIGPFVVLDGTGGLTIGSNCSISAGVQIYSHDSVKWAISGGTEKYEYAPVHIGDNCYIGPNTIIAKGVAIGDRCVIGANSLVLDDIPSSSKAFGTPCRVISLIDA